MKAVILAGGKGTRLGALCKEVPKPMVHVGDKPILQHQIELLKRYGISSIILMIHHLGGTIKKYFGDGSAFGASISYFEENKPLGTAGALAEVADYLDQDFLVFYGDVMMSINIPRFVSFHKQKKALCSLAVHPNDHPYDSDLVSVDDNSRVVAFHPKPHAKGALFQNLVNAAAYVMSSETLPYIQQGIFADLGKDIFPRLASTGRLYGYETAEYIKDAGTPERLEQVGKDYSSGKIEALNSEHKQRAIFIDRDGVINKEINLLHKLDDFILLPGVADAIKKINESRFLTVVATNQPVVARNLCTIEELKSIHNKMEFLLGQNGAKVDKIYFCPHHPDKGFPEENPRYKKDCVCRKPKIGMLEQAACDFNIDLKQSFFVGDSDRDIECGRSAGTTAMLVKRNGEEFSSLIDVNFCFNNLRDVVDFIMQLEQKKNVSSRRVEGHDYYKDAV